MQTTEARRHRATSKLHTENQDGEGVTQNNMTEFLAAKDYIEHREFFFEIYVIFCN